MAFTNYDTGEINCKIVYFGPTGAGKTENLRSIYRQTLPEVKDQVMALQDPESRAHLFDFLPLSLGKVGDLDLRLHLFTLPLTSPFPTTTSVVLRGLDGLIYVADSAMACLPENIAGLATVRETLEQEGIAAGDLPALVQYNKRDGDDPAPLSALRRGLNSQNWLEREASARQDQGTMDCLIAVTQQILRRLGSPDQGRAPKAGQDQNDAQPVSP